MIIIKISLSVFPNPASNYLDVIVDSEQSFHLLELFDMQGRKVLSQQLWDVKNRLDIQNLERGTYLLKVYSKGQAINKAYRFELIEIYIYVPSKLV